MSENSCVLSLCPLVPLRCAGTARLLALPDHSHSTQSTGYQPYAGEMDTQSVTGETLSWSPSTGPLTDDSVCGLTKQEPEGKPTGGNAVGGPCGILPNRSECRTAHKWKALEGTPTLLILIG